MCGSLKKALEETHGVGNVVIKSTDSDLIVHSYPNVFVDLFRLHLYAIDTKKLFDCL